MRTQGYEDADGDSRGPPKSVHLRELKGGLQRPSHLVEGFCFPKLGERPDGGFDQTPAASIKCLLLLNVGCA
jgi:hypothetical protein